MVLQALKTGKQNSCQLDDMIRYATQKAYPPEDTTQNWQLVSGIESQGKTVIEVSRLLSTGDATQDRPIVAGF